MQDESMDVLDDFKNFSITSVMQDIKKLSEEIKDNRDKVKKTAIGEILYTRLIGDNEDVL